MLQPAATLQETHLTGQGATVAPLKVLSVTSLQEFIPLKERWDDLLQNSNQNVVHLTHAWFLSWWESFQGSHQLYILAVENHKGQLIAIAPLLRGRCRYRGVPVQIISFMVNGHSPSADLILRKDQAVEGFKAVFAHLEADRDWDLLIFDKLSTEGHTYRLLIDYLKHSSYHTGLQDNIDTPFVLIDSSWETFLRTRTPRFRKTLRNKLNRATRSGDFTCERILIPNRHHPALNDMISISSKSWKNAAGTDLTADSAGRSFYMHICDRFGPLGSVTLWMLRKNVEPVAFELHLAFNRTAYPLRADYDDSFKQYSPGSLLEANILETLFRESIVQEYNSCGHSYDYLMNWTDQTRKHRNVEIFNRNSRALVLYMLEYRLLPLLRKIRLHRVKLFRQSWRIVYDYS
jgi:CelD/BcsL family acetyltransferase involved in cellulose biosynthesis